MFVILVLNCPCNRMGMNRGLLFVVSAPSGAGKTSLVNALRATIPDLTVSVSHTTRSQRPGEQEGQSYYFVGRDQFEKMISAGAFLEYAQVFDHYYGTARSTIEASLAVGIDTLLEIDWQGARQVRTLFPDCASIFIMPPSRQTLEQRLRERGQDHSETIARRMREAISEMSHFSEYDYLIVNDDFDEALAQLRSIVWAHRLKTRAQSKRLAALIDSLLSS